MSESQEREAALTQVLRWRDDGDGSLRFTGKVPAAQGEQFRALVEAIAEGQRLKPTATPTTDEPAGHQPADDADERIEEDEACTGFGSPGMSSLPGASATGAGDSGAEPTMDDGRRSARNPRADRRHQTQIRVWPSRACRSR